jgi:hypothetical protein
MVAEHAEHADMWTCVVDHTHISYLHICDRNPFWLHSRQEFCPGQVTRPEAIAVMKNMDANKDGKLSFKEFTTGILKWDEVQAWS